MSKIFLIELDFSSLKNKATTLTQGKSQLPGHTCSCLVCEFRGSLPLLQNLVMGQWLQCFFLVNDDQPLTSKTEFVRRCNFKGQSHAEGINSLTKWTFGLHLKGFSSFSWKASTRRSLLWNHFQGDAHSQKDFCTVTHAVQESFHSGSRYQKCQSSIKVMSFCH